MVPSNPIFLACACTYVCAADHFLIMHLLRRLHGLEETSRSEDSRGRLKEPGQDVVGTRRRWEQTLEAERSSPLFLVNFVRLGSVKNSGWDPQSSESSPSSSSARVSTCHPSASFLFPQTTPSIRTRQTLSQEQTLDTSYQAGMDAHVRRGHPVLFGVIALFALIEL
jgi:hypothetical protein